MTIRIALGFACIALAACQSVGARELPHKIQVDDVQVPNSAQLWAMSPKAAARQAKKDLNSLLIPPTHYPRGRVEVGYTSFTTRPRNSRVFGICARDTLSMQYSRTRAPAEGEDTTLLPMRPSSLDVMHEYRFVGEPTEESFNSGYARDGGVFREDCASLSGSETGWFVVDPYEDLKATAEGWLDLRLALDLLRTNPAILGKCGYENKDERDTCREQLFGLGDTRKLTRIRRASTPENLSYLFQLDGNDVTVHARPGTDSRWAKPGDIISIDVEPSDIMLYE